MPNSSQMNRFALAPTNIDIGRSIFNRDHSVKFSFNAGDLIPFYLDEVLPGDSFSVDTSKVVRVQPLVAPVMDNMYLDTYYFFIPNRLVWSHWINFMGENSDSAWIPEVTYSVPQIQIPEGGFDVGTIADYLGVPPKAGAGQEISALPFRCYAMVADQWFRDQNLMDPVNIELGDTTIQGSNGDNQITDIVKGGKPFKVAKYHDYFTSCLPAPQKSANPVTVQMEMDGVIPVVSGERHSLFGYTEPLTWKNTENGNNLSGLGNRGLGIVDSGKTISYSYSHTGGSTIAPDNLWAEGDFADITSGFTINELRFAFAMQKYYEKLARSGSRYIETIKSFFGVQSSDARMQRTEYLGGNRVPLNISQVENVTNTETNVEPIGSVAGLSVTGDVNSDFTKSFTEHGYILGVCCVRFKHTYQQGLENHWLRKNLFDFYNPVFANIGEQPVDIRTLYIDGYSSTSDTNTFGYQEAWAEYRYKPSRVAGEMRSVYPQSLDIWHFADYYVSRPYLSADWIREDKNLLDRSLAVTSSVSNQLIADFYITAQVTRPMPLYSVPGLIDHH